MLKVEVVRGYTKHVTGSKGDNAGKQFDIPMVECYAHLPGEKYPVRADYSLAKGEVAPSPGVYVVGPGSYYVNEYGSLALRRSLDLLPVPLEAKKST